MITKREWIGIAAFVLLVTLLGEAIPMMFSEGSWAAELSRNHDLSEQVDEHPLLKRYR